LFFSLLVCDIIRSQDVPNGIRQTLVPVSNGQNNQEQLVQSRGRSGDHYMLMDEEGRK